MDIVIYTTLDVLEHKKGADGYQFYYWTLSRSPKKLKRKDRVYLAIKGEVVGSFEVEEFNPNNKETIVWNKNSWQDLEIPIPTKHFQGFRYRWW